MASYIQKLVSQGQEDEIVHYEIGKDGKLKSDTMTPHESVEYKEGMSGNFEAEAQQSVRSFDSYNKIAASMQQIGKTGSRGSEEHAQGTHYSVITDTGGANTTSYTRTVSTQQPMVGYATTDSRGEFWSTGGAYITNDGTYGAYKPEEDQKTNYMSSSSYANAQSEYQKQPLVQGPQYKQLYQSVTPESLEAAIACGRVYAPPNSSYVTGMVVEKSGLNTTYDGNLIPTFETELEVMAMPKPALPALPKDGSTKTYEEKTMVQQEANGYGIVKKVTTNARRRMQCC